MCSAYKQALQVLSSFRFCPTDSEVLCDQRCRETGRSKLGRHLRKENRSIYLACPRPAKSIGLHCQGIRDYQINVKSMHLIYQLLNITAIATIIELSRPSKLPHTQYQPCDEYGMLHTPCSHQLSSLQPTWLQCTIGKDASGFMVN